MGSRSPSCVASTLDFDLVIAVFLTGGFFVYTVFVSLTAVGVFVLARVARVGPAGAVLTALIRLVVAIDVVVGVDAPTREVAAVLASASFLERVVIVLGIREFWYRFKVVNRRLPIANFRWIEVGHLFL